VLILHTSSEYYSLYLHDALPISFIEMQKMKFQQGPQGRTPASETTPEKVTFSIADLFKEGKLDIDPREKRELKQFIENFISSNRSEEHTSELQSRENLVCRLRLE